jgi:WD40 repeat protein
MSLITNSRLAIATLGVAAACSPITAHAATLITGLSEPNDVVISGGNLYVSNANRNNGFIGLYNAGTGAPINTNFIPTTGNPNGLAINGNDLLVANLFNNQIDKYNATTGATINANFASGFTGPTDLAISGSNFFTTNLGDGEIRKYDLATGNVDFNFNATTGGPVATGIAINNNDIYAANFIGGTIGRYNATDGTVINASFISGVAGVSGLAIDAGNLYVAAGQTISKYDLATGSLLDPALFSGLNQATGLAISNNNLYVANRGNNSVEVFSLSAQAVPEPFTIIGTVIGGTVALRMRKKLKDADNS